VVLGGCGSKGVERRICGSRGVESRVCGSRGVERRVCGSRGVERRVYGFRGQGLMISVWLTSDLCTVNSLWYRSI